MLNPYEPPTTKIIPTTIQRKSGSGNWYFLLLPISVAYTFVARELAGPISERGAPNQDNLVFFGLLLFFWPFLAILAIAVLQSLCRIRGYLESALGFLAWMISCVIPFLIGPK